MSDDREYREDFSLEEILADVRNSRTNPPKPEDIAQPGLDYVPSSEKQPADETTAEPKPASRRVPLYPEKEQKKKEPVREESIRQEEDGVITAEDLAEEEPEETPETPRRKNLRGLFSFGKKEKKKNTFLDMSDDEEENPYKDLHLKSREEYKRAYEKTMDFDSAPRSSEDSPYSYLFHSDGQDSDDDLAARADKMRAERHARLARAMKKAGYDEKSQTGGEDLFSMYQREEAQRAERSTHDAEAAARVLEKAGGPEPEEEPAEPERDEPAKAAEPSTREFPSLTVLDTPAAPARGKTADAGSTQTRRTGQTFKASRGAKRKPTETEIPVPQADAEQIPEDSVLRVNRPASQTRKKAAQPSFRPAPPPVFLTEQEEPKRQEPAQAKTKPAQDTPVRTAPPTAETEREQEPAPVKEPSPAAPTPAREPAPAPVREPEEAPQPRMLSNAKGNAKSGSHEHSYRSRKNRPAKVVTMEETPGELQEALDNEARTYPRPGRLSASAEPAEQHTQQAKQPAVHTDSTPQVKQQPAAHTEAPEEALPDAWAEFAPAANTAVKTKKSARTAPQDEPASTPIQPQETAVWDYDGWEEIESSSGKPLRGRTIPLHPTASPAPAEEEEGGEEAEETLKRKPGQKRHKRFSILGTEEKDNRPEDEFPVDPEEIEDYEKPEDAASILHDLGEKHRTLLLRAGVTGLSLFLMLLFGLISEYNGILPSFIPYYLLTQPYLILELIFLLIAGAFSWPVLLNGLKGLIRLQANSDSGVAVAVVASAIHTVLLLFSTARVDTASLHLYAPLAVLALFLNTLGKLSMVKRITKNFRFVASPDKKMAVHLLGDHNMALQMTRGYVEDSPAIAYQTKTGFLKNFLRISYLPDACEQSSQVIAPIGIVSSLLLCVAALLLSGDAMAALTAFTASCCICTPMLNQLCVNLPLAQASRLAGRHGAMISGYQALDKFSDTNAILLDAKELFPKNCVVLSGIKTFGDQHIDDAILDAAALLNQTGGTLSEIFDEVIQSRRDLLPKVENYTYEDNKGIVGWVSGHRLLIGTRDLLLAHHITPPSRDYEKKYALGGKKVLYLASGGQLVAMFLIAYNADRRRTIELCRLEDNGVAFLVRTCDPNITPELIAECFQLNARSVNVLTTRLGNVYVKAGKKPDAPAAAWLATKGRPTGMMRLVSLCIRQRGNISLAVALQNVAVGLGFVLVAFLACYSGLGKLNTLFLLIYELFWALAIVLLPKLRKP